jgi:hypothetical protein
MGALVAGDSGSYPRMGAGKRWHYGNAGRGVQNSSNALDGPIVLVLECACPWLLGSTSSALIKAMELSKVKDNTPYLKRKRAEKWIRKTRFSVLFFLDSDWV